MIGSGTRYAMGASLHVEAQSRDLVLAARARDVIFTEVRRLEELLSPHSSSGDISRINSAAGGEPTLVSPETFAAVERALGYAAATSGAFTPTVGSDFRDVALDPLRRTVLLSRPGMIIDLGGLGKGFSLDRAMAAAREIPELERAFIDFGGQLLFWTRGDFFEPVKVSIESPEKHGLVAAEFEVRSNCSVSTSSQAERAGRLIDPRTGRPASAVDSATVVAPTATEAEAWSTALLVLGAEGLEPLRRRDDVRTFLLPSRDQASRLKPWTRARPFRRL